MVYTYENLKVGDAGVFEKTITDADVLLFTAVSGDNNPMHINDAFARKSVFGQRIAHGALTASLISAAIARTFPASIYISQHTEFCAPVHIGDTVKAVVTCVEKMEKGRVRLRTECFDQEGVQVIKGEAAVRLAREIPAELL